MILCFSDRQHDVKTTCNDGRQRMAMNSEIPSVPITTLAGISSLTDCEYKNLI